MTEQKPRVRWIGMILVGGLVWWFTSWLSPPLARQQHVAYANAGKALLKSDAAAALIPEGGLGAVHVAPACDGALDTEITRLNIPTPKTGAAHTPGATHAPGAANTAEAAKPTLNLSCRWDDDDAKVIVSAWVGGGGDDAAVAERLGLPSGDSLLPPLVGIIIAMFFRQVVLALGMAVFFGAVLVSDWNLWEAVERTAGPYLWDTASDAWNLYIFGFTILLVGMVHICIRMGGMQGIVVALGRVARGRRSAQTATAAMGCAVFFDDYANTVVVGTSARSLTDRFRISREKLAYIVDSTAAPVAGIAIISTWVGFEVGIFNEQMHVIGDYASNGYEFFFQILPYRFYCLFSLALVFIITGTGRDFGPMLKAERRAARTGALRARSGVAPGRDTEGGPETRIKKGAVPRWYNGLLPILAVITGMFAASMVVGMGNLAAVNPSWSADLNILEMARDAFIGSQDEAMAILFWCALGGTLLAAGLALAQRILTPGEIAGAFANGLWMIGPIIAVLILAMSLRAVTDDLQTSSFLVALVGDVPLWILPVTIFGLAAFTAFSTGTSWATMGILIPVALPMVAELSAGHPEAGMFVMLAAAAVLDGAIFGDHCSVISDTTIMSSLSSGCDHIDHVKTQFPYALLAMLVAAGMGYLLMASAPKQIPVLASYGLGLLSLYAIVRLWGRRTEDQPSAEATKP